MTVCRGDDVQKCERLTACSVNFGSDLELHYLILEIRGNETHVEIYSYSASFSFPPCPMFDEDSR